MKNLLKLAGVFSLAALLFCVSCSKSSTSAKSLSIPFPPKPATLKVVGYQELSSNILGQFIAANPDFYFGNLIFRGEKYSLPTSDYVPQYNNFFFNAYHSLNLGYSSKNDVVCMSYSVMFSSFGAIEADNNNNTQLAIGSIIVRDVYTNLGVEGLGINTSIYHAVDVFVCDDNGKISLYICEPQNGRQCLLKDYTNAPYIVSVQFF